jgi:RNA polymerase sigma-70 factor, ECF subfamily
MGLMEQTAALFDLAGTPELTLGGDFDAVVQRYWPKVFRFAFASLGDRDAAETIAQDCFWKAYESRDRFRNDCSLNSWLMRIAVNLIRDHARNRRLQFWRRATRFGSAPEQFAERWADERISPEQGAVLKQQLTAVWQAASNLPERQRTVFLLRFVEEMEILEIARVTGLREGTVKAHLFRAVQSVRKRIEATK